MIADTFTYLPPIWPITSAYSFSAPMAMILVVDAAAPVELPPDEDDEDEQALASSTAARGRATARTPERVLMTLFSRWGKRRLGGGGY
jgi:hypothetical protein